MDDGFAGGVFSLGQGVLVEALVEDGFHALIAGGIEVQGPTTGGLQSLIPVGCAQPQNAQAGAEALLRVRPRAEDDRDQLSRGRASLLSPVHQTFRCPAGRVPMCPGYVLGERGMAPLQRGSPVTGTPCVVVQQLQGVGGHAHIQLLFDQLVGHRVVVAQHLDMIINMDPGVLPLGRGRALAGQGQHGRAVNLLEQIPAATGQFFEGSLVEVDQQIPECSIELRQ